MGRQVPTESVKHEVRAKQIVLEKKTKAEERTEDVAKSEVQREGSPSKSQRCVRAKQVVLGKQTKAEERTEDVAKGDAQREGSPSQVQRCVCAKQ